MTLAIPKTPLLVVCAALCPALQASAVQTTWSYQSGNFVIPTANFSTADSVSGTVTFEDAPSGTTTVGVGNGPNQANIVAITMTASGNVPVTFTGLGNAGNLPNWRFQFDGGGDLVGAAIKFQGNVAGGLDPESVTVDNQFYFLPLNYPVQIHLDEAGIISPVAIAEDFGTFTLVPAPPLIGDLNLDGFVGIADLNIVLGNWNLNVPPADPLADPSGDNFIGIADLNVVLGNWNAGTPPGDTANIPEPTSLLLLAVCGVSLVGRSRVRSTPAGWRAPASSWVCG